MNLVELAQRIKARRLDKRLTLEEVASRTGLTRSWLSKVENFRVTPSLPALGQIAAALETPVASLFEGLEEHPRIVTVRRSERRVVERDKPHSHIRYESLAFPRPDRKMDPFMLIVPPDETKRLALPHEGEEFLLVIAGRVDFEYDGELFKLKAGDSLYFDASAKHRLINGYKKAAEVLCVFFDSNGHGA